MNRSSASPGDILTYSIAIENTGGADATDVTARDPIGSLLSHASFVGATDGGTRKGEAVVWSGLSVKAGSTRTVAFSLRLEDAGWGKGTTALTNTVTVPESDCASGSSNANCSATTTITVEPRLVVHKSVNATSADPGDTLAYTITVQNTGTGNAADVIVDDNIGALLAHGSFSARPRAATSTAPQ